MRPDPQPTLLEQAEGFEVSAQISYRKGDLVFAKEQSDHAHYLRMRHEQESKKNDQLKKD